MPPSRQAFPRPKARPRPSLLRPRTPWTPPSLNRPQAKTRPFSPTRPRPPALSLPPSPLLRWSPPPSPVPILSLASNQSSEAAQEIVTGWNQLGSLVLHALHAARDDVIERDGIWATLTRQAANRLVRLVRKARDAAYGKDE